MANTLSDTQEHFQHNLNRNHDTAVFAASATESVIMSSSVTKSTMQMYTARSSIHPISPEHFAGRSMAITSASQSHDVNYSSYYDMIQNDSARNAYNTPPPPLPHIVSVALPPLSPNIPIQIHDLITYRRSTPPIYWNMSHPPSAALLRLAIADSTTSSRLRWSRDIAVEPNVSSFTIRIRGVARPVVVFPAEVGLSIRIFEILRAVYSAMRVEALENGAGASGVPSYRANGQRSTRLAADDGSSADAIRRKFRNRVWWNGLSQSTNEVDVWVLHLRTRAKPT